MVSWFFTLLSGASMKMTNFFIHKSRLHLTLALIKNLDYRVKIMPFTSCQRIEKRLLISSAVNLCVLIRIRCISKALYTLKREE